HAANPHGGAAGPDAPEIVSGEIEASPALASEVKKGDVVFVTARAVDASGNVQRAPLAVERLEVDALPMPFRMVGSGEGASGSVQVTARVDRDGDAISRNPGDIEGAVKTSVPAKGVKIVLDTKVAP